MPCAARRCQQKSIDICKGAALRHRRKDDPLSLDFDYSWAHPIKLESDRQHDNERPFIITRCRRSRPEGDVGGVSDDVEYLDVKGHPSVPEHEHWARAAQIDLIAAGRLRIVRKMEGASAAGPTGRIHFQPREKIDRGQVRSRRYAVLQPEQ
ncbi:IS1096 element passenger TnpR family protein [Bradyrhizobium forestalis]|uniref:IS1096 element passenger TnpR family protein n=1 Tax=Bradyrhizobium forestalis TaxID=1419263 RepID=UPI003D31EB53